MDIVLSTLHIDKRHQSEAIPSWIIEYDEELCIVYNKTNSTGRQIVLEGKTYNTFSFDWAYYQIVKCLRDGPDADKNAQTKARQIWSQLPELSWEQDLVRLDRGNLQWHKEPYRFGWQLPRYGLTTYEFGRRDYVTPVIPKKLADKLDLQYSQTHRIKHAAVWWYFEKSKVLAQTTADLGKVCLEFKKSEAVSELLEDTLQFYRPHGAHRVNGSREITEASEVSGIGLV